MDVPNLKGDGWTDWIQHNGGPCPCVGRYATLRFSVDLVELGCPIGYQDKDGMIVLDRFTAIGVAQDGMSWYATPGYLPGIICYRLKRPSQLVKLVKLVQDIDPKDHPELVERDGLGVD